MITTRFSIIGFAVILAATTAPVYGDEPTYECTLTLPDSPVTAGQTFRVAGYFVHSPEVRQPDRVYVEITKMVMNPPLPWITTGAMKLPNLLTRTDFDTNDFLEDYKPIVPTAGTYTITVKAQKKVGDGPDDYETLGEKTQMITAN